MADDGAARDVVLPDAVRHRVVAAASVLLGSLATNEIPLPLRRIAKFAPARRARAGAVIILDTLATDVVLRHRVGDAVASALPVLAAAVRAGENPPDADPVDVAALAYLLRPDSWPLIVSTVAAELRRRAADQEAATRDLTVERIGDELAALRAASRDALASVRTELDAARAENGRLRERLAAAQLETRAASRSVEEAEARYRAAQGEAAALTEAELRRLHGRLAEAERALETSRRAVRDSRTIESMRARLLVDTLVDAAQGLRRELALPPLHARPADLVTGLEPAEVVPGSRGRDAADPALLGELLAVPHVHLVVDGYNVTKSGYGDLPLEDQRGRLVMALGALAARTQAEITCVFDGRDLAGPVPVASARRVRVRFSASGVTADDVIRELVQAEPPGRPVVVVTNDAEILRDVRLSGAWTAATAALLAMLGAR